MCVKSPEDMYNALIKCSIISNEELDEICDEKGFTEETLTKVLFERYGTRDFSELLDNQ